MDMMPPFVGSEDGDLWLFEKIESPGVEIADIDSMEFFDAEGRPLLIRVDANRVHLEVGVATEKQPERLEALIRGYFRRLPPKDQVYSARVTDTSSLSELVSLLRDLQAEGHYERLRRHFK